MAAETFRPNFYASAAVDRLGHLRRDERWIAERLADPATRILPVWRTHNLVISGGAPSAAWLSVERAGPVGSSRVDLQACKLEYSIVSPK